MRNRLLFPALLALLACAVTPAPAPAAPVTPPAIRNVDSRAAPVLATTTVRELAIPIDSTVSIEVSTDTMRISLTAGGTPESTIAALKAQAKAYLATAGDPSHAKAMEGAIESAEKEIADVPPNGSVSIGISLNVNVTKPLANKTSG